MAHNPGKDMCMLHFLLLCASMDDSAVNDHKCSVDSGHGACLTKVA